MSVEVRMLALVARTALRCERLLLRYLLRARAGVGESLVMVHNDEAVRLAGMWEEAGGCGTSACSAG